MDEDSPFISPLRHLAPDRFKLLLLGQDHPDEETKQPLFLTPKLLCLGTLQGSCKVQGFDLQEQHISSCSSLELAQMGV